jgi:hypothetical protein
MVSQKPLRFVSLRHVEARPDSNSVYVEMIAEDRQPFGFEIDAECAAPSLAAIAGALGQLPQEADANFQFLQGKGLNFGHLEDGTPVFVLTLAGGAVLRILLRSGDLTGLIEELQGLKSLGDRRPH